jgi:hypothetical protein
MKSLQSTLHALSFDPDLARLFSATPWEAVVQIASWVAARDPYGECRSLAQALSIASGNGGDVQACLRHQFWCAWRQAAWTNKCAEPLPVRCEGFHWLAETEGRPTLLVGPMTLSPGDAMSVIAQVNTTRRPCIVFGEDIDTGGNGAADAVEMVSGMSAATVRRIIEVLSEGGILCTYPDFVYEGHMAESIPLFGKSRPVSSGFLSLAERNGTMLLPFACFHEQDETGDILVLHMEEPLEVQVNARRDSAHRHAARALLADTIGELLAGLIRRSPEQWLLLPTLTFESPQMARLRPRQESTPSTP